MSAILIVEDEAVLAKNIALFLTRHGFQTKIAGCAEDALRELDSFRPDAVVLDFNLPQMNGLEFLSLVRAREPGVKIIMTTGHGSEQIAVDAMKAGAYDYLTKPLALGKLKLVLDRALHDEKRDSELGYHRRRVAATAGLDKLLGSSSALGTIKELIKQILVAEHNLADGTLPAISITGETGTGKELVARALHFDGARSRKPFVEVNCSSIPSNLLEAELFGYERGAFTDARERKIGLIEAADGGTLFLDEIGEMDLALQAKLLRVLEDKSVRRLGSVREQKVDVRIVSATNHDLQQLVSEGKFRADLYFRLHIMPIALPPLRERGDDVIELAQHFLAQHAARYGKQGLAFDQPALDKLRAHSWPGNVRELRNIIEQCVILARGSVVSADQLAIDGQSINAQLRAQALPIEDVKLTQIECGALKKALDQTHWNVTQAARLLGVSRDTLRYRMEKYQLTRLN